MTIYTEPLPKAKNIERLVRAAGPFPATAGAVMETARRRGLDADTLHFLELFPEDEIFESREDLSTRSEELIFLIKEEQAEEEGEN
ncbi:MAG TPA: DUF2795 domain-containing protein [Candidatus Saccharimonadales bacterium]|nr:DUF2795 domain-containing protein [Candidatus Saccharimonadales bacterium]